MRPARTGMMCVIVLSLLTSLWAAGARAQESVNAPLKIPDTVLEPVAFSAMQGWHEDDQSAALAAFRKSCQALMRRPDNPGMQPVERGLREACGRLALYREPVSAIAARIFFEQNFVAVRIARLGEEAGFVTGYYEPEIEGSLIRKDGFDHPIYRKPGELVSRMQQPSKINRPVRASARKSKTGVRQGARIAAFYDRAAIEDGALRGRGLEICWLKDPIDSFFAHIQGSARIRLPDGKLLRINYAAQNGHPYFAVGRSLIERGIVPAEEMSMDKIRLFISEHPEEGRELMRMNRSYIFFREVNELGEDAEPVGAQGISLTRDRSIAVDRNLHIYGTPFWIDATLPLRTEKARDTFRRLMVAQDTGGAIIGPARADIYFGAGLEAGSVAGRLRHPGQFYMLVPNSADPSKRIDPVPLPEPRPKQ